MAEINNTIVSSIITTVIAFLISIGFGYIVANRISKPIVILSNAALKIENSQFEPIQDIQSNDEIGVLALAFNHMSSHLNELIESLKSAKKDSDTRLLIFRQYVESSGQGMAMATLDGHITYVNPAILEMVGEKKAEDLMNHQFQDYYPDDFKQKIREEVMPAVFEQGQWKGELALISKNGDTIPTIENIFIIRDEKGSPLYLANIMTNVSKLKTQEKELIIEKNKAEIATRAKSDFLASMSHEIRTPMNAILGYTELMQTTELNDEQQNFAKNVYRSSESLLALIDNILDFSKIESNKLELDIESFIPGDVLSDAIEELRFQLNLEKMYLT